MATIADLKNALGTGGRSNKYNLNFSIPAAVPTTSNIQNASVLCKATTFPSMTIGEIEVFNQGRKLVIPGDTTYTNTWQVTFYNTEDHGLRRDLISWMHAIDDFQNNSHTGDLNSVMGELSVQQLDSAGNPTTTYTFHNVFVSEVAELALDGEQQNTIQEFEVTFSFSDWVVGNGNSNNPASFNAATKNPIAK